MRFALVPRHGIVAYALLIVMLRVSGKRTLSKLNAFDLVVTVAMGSILASALLTKDVALAEALTAFGVLILGQFVVAKLAYRWKWFAAAVKSRPTLLMFQGRFIDSALAEERVTRSDVETAIRSAGVATVEEVGAVVLEADGSLQVVRADALERGHSALAEVEGTSGPASSG